MVVMGYSRKTSFCRGMPSDWAKVVRGRKTMHRVISVAVSNFLCIINTSFCFFGTDFTDFTVFVVVIDIQAPEFLLRTIRLSAEKAKSHNIMFIQAKISS